MSNSQISLLSKIKETVAFLNERFRFEPEIGIILGTGLGRLADEIKVEKIFDYSEIPNFPISTVESHSGKLVFGMLGGKKVVAMQGRFHYYEGYSMQEITFPVRVMKYLGISSIIISNACGSLNPYIPKASVMLIPLIGKHEAEFGPRIVDMSEPYSRELSALAEKTALELGIKLFKGVYAAMSGPSLETRAEYRFLRYIGADVIGMSTVPECIVANQMGLKVLGFSIVTDECYPDALKPTSLEEMIEVAGIAEINLTKLTKGVIEKI